MEINNENKKIILFDGICLLCNSAVYFLHQRLRYSNYKFIASQSDEGKEIIDNKNLEQLTKESIVLIEDENILIKSNAILRIIDDLHYIWHIFKLAKIIPLPIRNWAYDLVSKYRHLIFGKVNE